ncbi:hypothetical protein, partial [Acinetobacter baumannii]|uniref:hypothetical protein n=1 Tax=Acinetobacter baumannii TaxID=470 RepID=UPI001FF2F288
LPKLRLKFGSIRGALHFKSLCNKAKMLYNEKETLFKPTCNYARYTPTSFYYDYIKLKQCYQMQ